MDLHIPRWVQRWIDLAGLKEEVILWREERPDNTTHRTDRREALGAVRRRLALLNNYNQVRQAE